MFLYYCLSTANVYEWQYLNDNNEWIAYNSNISSTIQQALDSGKTFVGFVDLENTESYREIHFNERKQHEILTDVICDVRQVKVGMNNNKPSRVLSSQSINSNSCSAG